MSNLFSRLAFEFRKGDKNVRHAELVEASLPHRCNAVQRGGRDASTSLRSAQHDERFLI